MNDAVCGEQAAVRSAADRGEWGEVMAHVARCEACAAVMPELMEAGSGSADTLLSRITEDEAALILAEGFDAPAAAGSPGDAARLARARAALADEGGGGRVLAFPPGGRRRWPWAAALAAAAAALLVVGVWSQRGGAVGEGGEVALVGRTAVDGKTLELRAVVGESHCFSRRLHTPKRCQWDPARQDLSMHYRLEPVRGARYLAIFARDAAGEVTQMFPEPGQAQGPLTDTRNQKSNLCHAGLCWLTGGKYAGVEPGPMTLIGVFDDAPLPLDELARAVKSPEWSDTTRVVDRLELEVAR